MCGSQTLKQEAITLKLSWRLPDVGDARVEVYLLRKSGNREWNQSGVDSFENPRFLLPVPYSLLRSSSPFSSGTLISWIEGSSPWYLSLSFL